MKLLASLSLFCCVLHLEALSLDNVKSDILPSKDICGIQHSDDVVEEFPWMVFIPLKSRVYNPDANIRCAGTLINKRYVMTAKTCLQFVLTKVHLGQHDTSKNVSCVEDDCKPVLELGVEGRVVDENKDIVLLRLEKDVEFTDRIKPICLPFDDFKKPETGATVFTSGWGLLSPEGPANSKLKKKVKHTLISNEDCKKAGVIQDADNKNSICVKVQDDSLSKPCNGEEGSPIMFDSGSGKWVIEGISVHLFDLDTKACAIKNPVRGFQITEDDLQWMIEKMHA